MQLDILNSAKNQLAKGNFQAAILLLKNQLIAQKAHIAAQQLLKEVEPFERYRFGQMYYDEGVRNVIERQIENMELSASLGFKVADAAPEHAPTSVTSAYEAMEIWLLTPKSSLGDSTGDLISHCEAVAQTLEATQLGDVADEFALIARRARRSGADLATLIAEAKKIFDEQVLPIIKELRQPIGEEALKQQALSQNATLKDIEALIDVLPKGELKATLKDIQKSKKSDVVKVILSKLAIQKHSA